MIHLVWPLQLVVCYKWPHLSLGSLYILLLYGKNMQLIRLCLLTYLIQLWLPSPHLISICLYLLMLQWVHSLVYRTLLAPALLWCTYYYYHTCRQRNWKCLMQITCLFIVDTFTFCFLQQPVCFICSISLQYLGGGT